MKSARPLSRLGRGVEQPALRETTNLAERTAAPTRMAARV
jgi:hypothetical protein